MGTEDDTEVRAPNTWLGFASKYGLAGVVIFMMGGFIWVMFNFIAGGQATKLTNIEAGMSSLIQLQKDEMAQSKDQHKDEVEMHKEEVTKLGEIREALRRR